MKHLQLMIGDVTMSATEEIQILGKNSQYASQFLIILLA